MPRTRAYRPTGRTLPRAIRQDRRPFREALVPGYNTRTLTVAVGAHRYRLRVLSDSQQFADPDGHGERLGISSAQWSHFGQIWPSGRLLAEAKIGRASCRERAKSPAEPPAPAN